MSARPKKVKGHVQRALDNRESKVIENIKTGLFVKGHKTSQVVNDALKDMSCLKKPYGKKFNKKKSNTASTPFDDETGIEFFSNKNDASLFMFGTHSKKRPHNLIVGRLFDFHILDMIEFGITNFKPISEFRSSSHPQAGSKPCFNIIGSIFQTDSKYEIAANLFVDFFRGAIVKEINLQGLDHVIVLAAGDQPDTISFRHYAIKLLKSGSHVPKVELDEIGPSMTLTFRRTKFASLELRKQAELVPKELNPKKVKNISTNSMHDKIATVHIPQQNVDKVLANVTVPKALRNHGKRSRDADSEGDVATSPTKKQKKLAETAVDI